MGETIPNEIRSFSLEIRSDGLKREIDVLREISFTKSCVAFLTNWLVIAGAIWLVANVSYWWTALAVILIGSRQRAMSNLVHDGSHGNLFKNSKLNDIASNLLAALPMGESVRNYRTSHSKHHKYLGTIYDDPDLESHRDRPGILLPLTMLVIS
jgi:fatty acid desaturase